MALLANFANSYAHNGDLLDPRGVFNVWVFVSPVSKQAESGKKQRYVFIKS